MFGQLMGDEELSIIKETSLKFSKFNKKEDLLAEKKTLAAHHILLTPIGRCHWFQIILGAIPLLFNFLYLLE